MDHTTELASTEPRSRRQPHPPARDGSFDLLRQIDSLRASAEYRDHGHAAHTLIKTPTLRIVLVALARGKKLAEHSVAEPVSIQVLGGRIRIDLPGCPVDHGTGRLMSLERDVPHDVQALTDAAFLMTLPWAPEE
jgi:quercetin dioxygenase-like cupin family protein